MKKNVLILVILFLSYNLLFCDEKDSVQKYSGTSYYGDILKVYDYLPAPINKRLFVSIDNNFLPGKGFYYSDANNSKNFPLYEIGFSILYCIPSWYNSGLFGWDRAEIGIYFKNTIGYKSIQTIGVAAKIVLDNVPITFMENVGIILAREDPNIELELGFGYDLYFSNLIISPKIMFNISDIYHDISYLHSNDKYYSGSKPFFYFGVNIGKIF